MATKPMRAIGVTITRDSFGCALFEEASE